MEGGWRMSHVHVHGRQGRLNPRRPPGGWRRWRCQHHPALRATACTPEQPAWPSKLHHCPLGVLPCVRKVPMYHAPHSNSRRGAARRPGRPPSHLGAQEAQLVPQPLILVPQPPVLVLELRRPAVGAFERGFDFPTLVLQMVFLQAGGAGRAGGVSRAGRMLHRAACVGSMAMEAEAAEHAACMHESGWAPFCMTCMQHMLAAACVC